MSMSWNDSRRRFLKTSLLSGLAAWTAAQFSGRANAQQQPPDGRGAGLRGRGMGRGMEQQAGPATLPAVAPAKVAFTAGDSRPDNTFKALKVFEKEIAQAIGNKRVILKPNMVTTNRALCATHADQLEAILDFLKSIGKTDIVIAESTATGSALEGFANYDYNKFEGKYGVKFIEIDKTEFETIPVFDQNDMRPKPCRVTKLLMDPNNYIISATRFKTHDRAVVTLSLKNIVVGAPIKDSGGGAGGRGMRGGRNDKQLAHGGGARGINYNLAAMAPRLHPHLAVLDGFEGMEGPGPISGTPVDHRVCVVSPDWYAADRVAMALMGVDLDKVGYMTYLAQAGLGQWDLDKIEVVGPAIKDHVKPYKLSNTLEEQLQWRNRPQYS